MSEMMFALGLQERMVGVTGITGWYKMTPEFEQALGDIPELAPKYPNMETLLEVDPDFFFAGWYYGMRPGGEVTPDTLSEYGIPVYVLSESCAHVDDDPQPANMTTLYGDLLNLGRIFRVEAEAETLVADWKERIETIDEALGDRPRPRVFLYDSGEDQPFTAGGYAMPTALIEAAGGDNVMADVEASWGRVSWEAVADRNPEFIILLDYQKEAGGWQDLWHFLERLPAMAETDAVKNKRFLALKYQEITPGPSNIEAVEALARALHPDAFR